jgi:hypothetical protein
MTLFWGLETGEVRYLPFSAFPIVDRYIRWVVRNTKSGWTIPPFTVGIREKPAGQGNLHPLGGKHTLLKRVVWCGQSEKGIVCISSFSLSSYVAWMLSLDLTDLLWTIWTRSWMECVANLQMVLEEADLGSRGHYGTLAGQNEEKLEIQLPHMLIVNTNRTSYWLRNSSPWYIYSLEKLKYVFTQILTHKCSCQH